VRFDPQQRAVVQQAIEDIWRLVMGRRHHLDAVGAVLIGEMGIEAEAGNAPIAGIDFAGGTSFADRACTSAKPWHRPERKPH
jgi:hypothetical protein